MAERQIPGGPFVNETGTAQRQIPGAPFINETVAAAGAAFVAELTAASFGFTANALTRFNEWIAALSAPAFSFTANALTRFNAFIVGLTAPLFNFTAQAATYDDGTEPEAADPVYGVSSYWRRKKHHGGQ